MKNFSKFIFMLPMVSLMLTSCGKAQAHVHQAGEPVKENVVQATCTEDGSYDLVTYCVEDKVEMSREHKIVPALGHDYQFDSFVWTNFTAKAKYVCSHDSSHVELHDAEVTSVVTTPASCETDGLKTYTASYDGHTDTKTEVIQSSGHDYQFDSFVWTNFTAKAKYICSHNHEHVALYDAQMSDEITTPAGCETEGVRTYTASYDGHTDTKTESIPAIEHDWNNPTYQWSADHSQCTAKRVCKNNAAHVESETVDSSCQVITPATKTSEGLSIFTATFVNTAFATQEENVVTERIVVYNGDTPKVINQTTIQYGLYPQTVVSDASLITALNALTTKESNGWYLYDDEYYHKVNSAKPYFTTEQVWNGEEYVVGSRFENGQKIETNSSYWFKCEPITWKVLSENNGDYLLLSEKCLEVSSYNAVTNGTHPNKYSDSNARYSVRALATKAFSLRSDCLLTTTVDNSKETTNNPESNSHAGTSTEDNAFLLSYQDYLNPAYGFSSDPNEYDAARYAKTTDYARAIGAVYKREIEVLFNGSYWTRSPRDANKAHACYVDNEGGVGATGEITRNDYCIRPAVTIRLGSN